VISLTIRSAGLGVKLLTSAVLLVFLMLSSLYGQGIKNEDCFECHEPASDESAGGYDPRLTLSAHSGIECLDCHEAVNELPHADDLADVDCGSCHSDAVEAYVGHGRRPVAGGLDIPGCTDCHGDHNILPATDRKALTNPLNLPKTCGRCHEDLDLTKRHEILYGKAVEVYQSSVHGRASLGGVYTAATCNDCHSTGGTAHRILGPGDPESAINHFNIPKTCGNCHKNIENDYWEGIHGKLVSRGETDAPICTDCHGEHGIISPSDPDSRVSPSRVAEATCSPCHESARLNEKYGTPTERLQTWVDSYHGLKSHAGDMSVANCASCHGAHRILPHTDSTSSIHINNLQSTCGSCHPGISATLAATPIHGTPGITNSPAASTIRTIYVVAIVVIIGLMIIHWLLDLFRKIKNVSLTKQVERMTKGEVWQHTFLMVSFVTLAITGFALRYSESWWVDFLFGWEGGFPVRGVIHYVAASVFVITVIWHLMYLTSERGRKFLKDMRPQLNDYVGFVQMNLFNLGLRSKRPLFGRFSYVEKAEYWALVWGTAIMAVSGFFLMFEEIAVDLFPKGFLDVMLVIHYYEAVLATLAIFIWHLYSTVFNPDVYPMNPAWYSGKMPHHVYAHEHPLDPVITGVEEEKPPDTSV
jgi:cytochrome b subunit of formate dehydrogenase